jgi:spore maturation protein CgeB
MVANTRGVRRSIIEDLTPTVHDLAIYGKGWTPDFVDPVHVRDERIPNRDLHRYYSAAAIVLNDHWPDMRSAGFLSNRLYDALASGAFVVSDAARGIEDEFDGAVVTYADRQELRQVVDAYLADPAARRALADRGREVVLSRHTFAHRVDQILKEVEAVGGARPRAIERWPEIDRWLARRGNRVAASHPESPALLAGPGDIA